jgi:hypothetical protein
MFGMLENPQAGVEKCSFCDKVGRYIGGLQAATSALERDRKWLNSSRVYEAGFFDKIKILLGYYILFYSIGYNIDSMWTSGLL